MAKSSKDAYGAQGGGNLLYFDPSKLVLVTDKGHPLYDERVHLPLDEAMVANVMYHGVKQPINIRKNPENGDIEVVAGRQRVKHAIEANRRLVEQGRPEILVPAVAAKGDEASLFDIMVSENEIRQDDTPLGRAEKMARAAGFSRTEAQIAVAFGVTPQTVKYHLALLECCAAVRKAVDEGKINISHVKVLAKMEPAEQKAKVAELVAAGEGAKGHEKARKQREALAGDKPRLKGIKEIKAKLEESKGAYADALRWVLGTEE